METNSMKLFGQKTTSEDAEEKEASVDEQEETASSSTERVAVNPKTGKRRTIEPGGSLPNGWQWTQPE